MQYNPLKTLNPSDEDMTANSSIWLCSRIMPGRGNDKISFPHFRILFNTGARVCDFSDLMINGIMGINDSGDMTNMSSQTSVLEYKGLWTIHNKAVIGECSSSSGLVFPFNTFNIGQRYKNGWRASRGN